MTSHNEDDNAEPNQRTREKHDDVGQKLGKFDGRQRNQGESAENCEAPSNEKQQHCNRRDLKTVLFIYPAYELEDGELHVV